jgi:hypothetical protein
LRNGIGVIYNDLQHEACRHVSPLLPDFDPTRTGRYDSAMKPLAVTERSLGQTQAFREKLSHRLSLLSNSANPYAQHFHTSSSLYSYCN